MNRLLLRKSEIVFEVFDEWLRMCENKKPNTKIDGQIQEYYARIRTSIGSIFAKELCTRLDQSLQLATDLKLYRLKFVKLNISSMEDWDKLYEATKFML